MANHQSVRDTLEALDRNTDLSRSLNNAYSTPLRPRSPRPELLSSPHFTLPNRKRPRDVLSSPTDSDFPHIKSRRTTPSPAVSASDTPEDTSTDDLDESDDDIDPTLKRLLGEEFGGDLKIMRREQRKAEKALQERREQERRDEEYARLCEQDQDVVSPQVASQPSNHLQSRLELQNGRLGAMRPPPPPQRPLLPMLVPESRSYPVQETQSTHMPGEFPLDHNNYGNLSSPSDSSDGFEEINPLDFRPNARQTPQTTSRAAESRYPTTYHGYGGSSVYAPHPMSAQSAYNEAYALVDHEINSFGAIPPGFGSVLRTLGDKMGDAMPARLSDPDEYSHADPTKTAEELKTLLENIRPDEETRPEEREPTPRSMRVELMPHQKLGLTWMKAMEQGTNKGGLLADDMGLGKTVQALALIVSRKPPPDSPRRTNLIVAPVALMQQWKREIERLIRPGSHSLTVHIFHGEGRKFRWTDLRNFDIVLTTYGTLASEHKRKLLWDEKVERFPNIQPTRNEGHYPLLGPRSQWFRVILDEAQWIKNKNTRSALAAYSLNAEYRWCLTGTPMQNNLGELHSLIKFLGIRPFNSTERFNSEFLRPLMGRGTEAAKDRAMEKLQALLKAILLRRTKKSTVDGRPLLQLPERTTEVAHAPFGEDQLAFYKSVENKTQLTYNRYLNAGEVGRNYSQILVLLLRMRQACCHPALLKDHGVPTGAGQNDIDLIENARSLPTDVIARLCNEAGFECPICMDAIENPIVFYPCGHWSCSECFSRISDPATAALNAADDGRVEVKCPNCRGKIDPRRNTDLYSFNKVHKDGDADRQEDPHSKEEDTSSDDHSTDDETDDDSDDGSIGSFVVDDEDEIEYDSESEGDESYRKGKTPFEKSSKVDKKSTGKKSRSKSRKSKKGKGKQKAKEGKSLTLAELKKASLRSKAMKKKYIRKLEKDWESSAKIDKTMEILESVDQGSANEKTIIFCSFTSFLDLLEVPISRKGFDYCRYDGSMNPKERNEAVMDFSDRPECRVMLVSLKAGNSGLNLTAASQGKAS